MKQSILAAVLALVFILGGFEILAQEGRQDYVPLKEYTVKTLYSPPEGDRTAGGSYPRVIQIADPTA